VTPTWTDKPTIEDFTETYTVTPVVEVISYTKETTVDGSVVIENLKTTETVTPVVELMSYKEFFTASWTSTPIEVTKTTTVTVIPTVEVETVTNSFTSPGYSEIESHL
jgi:hypothetical protein